MKIDILFSCNILMKHFETFFIMTIDLHNTMIIIKKEKKLETYIYIHVSNFFSYIYIYVFTSIADDAR